MLNYFRSRLNRCYVEIFYILTTNYSDKWRNCQLVMERAILVNVMFRIWNWHERYFLFRTLCISPWLTTECYSLLTENRESAINTAYLFLSAVSIAMFAFQFLLLLKSFLCRVTCGIRLSDGSAHNKIGWLQNNFSSTFRQVILDQRFLWAQTYRILIRECTCTSMFSKNMTSLHALKKMEDLTYRSQLVHFCLWTLLLLEIFWLKVSPFELKKITISINYIWYF